MGEIIGKGGSEVAINWKEVQQGTGKYEPVLVKFPDNIAIPIQQKIIKIVDELAEKVAIITNNAINLRTKNPKDFSRLIKTDVYDGIQFGVQGGQMSLAWNVEELKKLEKNYINSEVDNELAKLDQKKGHIYNFVVHSVVLALKRNIGQYYTIVAAENIQIHDETTSPISYFKAVYNLPIIKSIAYSVFKTVKFQ